LSTSAPADAGLPPPLVLTHGYADSALSWQPVADSLSRSFQVKLWDLPGHGSRRDEPADYSSAAAEAELRSHVTAAGPSSVLVGHSAGGYLTLRLAVQAPELASALVLIGTGPGYRKPAQMAAWNRNVARFVAATGMPPASAALVEMHDSLVLDNLGRLDMPVLIVVGANDLPAYVQGAQYLSTRIPWAAVRQIEGAGHDLHRTRAEELARIISDFAGT
jgi:pimeloyl-ACP methyl ester carboxylesterase